MQLPSLNVIFDKSRATFLRFPFALLSATLAAIIAVYLIGTQQADEIRHGYSGLLVCILGISLFTALPLTGENHGWSRPAILLGNSIIAGALLLYFFLLPAKLGEAPSRHIFRYLLFFLSAHLLVAVAPFVRGTSTNGFWQYNKTLFLRFMTAVLFSGALFVGLAIALGSVEVLFGADIEEEIYLQLFVLIGFIFNTWFFLAGIPSPLHQLQHLTAYPKGLKVFTQHILLPLVTVYLVILYGYTAKIMLQWSWPEGWVANLVLSFSIVGLLALLLLHPVRDKTENQWIRRFSRIYFFALIPLVILLLLAIGVRIHAYSFTVERYFVLALGLWLAGIVGYFILSKRPNIKIIPASLGIIAILISFGPWGAFSVAERSQVSRLRHYLRQNDILRQGTIHKATDPVPLEDRREISSILRYLNDTHGLDGIQPWFEQDLSKLATADSTQKITHYNRPEYVAKLMGIDFTLVAPGRPGVETVIHFNARPNHLLQIHPYEWLAPDLYIRPNQLADSLQLNEEIFLIRLADDSLNLRFSLKGQPEEALKLPVDSLANVLLQKIPAPNQSFPPEQMTVEAKNNRWRVKIYFQSLGIQQAKGSHRLESAQMDLLLKSVSKE